MVGDVARILVRTLVRRIVNEEVKVVGFSEVVREDDLLLEVENGYPSAVERDPRLCSLGRELVENGGRHKLGKGQTKYTQTSTTGGEEKLYREEGRRGGGGGRRSRPLRVRVRVDGKQMTGWTTDSASPAQSRVHTRFPHPLPHSTEKPFLSLPAWVENRRSVRAVWEANGDPGATLCLGSHLDLPTYPHATPKDNLRGVDGSSVQWS